LDKHSSLLRKSVNYGRKFFIVQAAGDLTGRKLQMKIFN